MDKLMGLLLRAAIVLVLLAVVVGILQLTLVLVSVIVPVAFLFGLLYLGYRSWQGKVIAKGRRSRW